MTSLPAKAVIDTMPHTNIAGWSMTAEWLYLLLLMLVYALMLLVLFGHLERRWLLGTGGGDQAAFAILEHHVTRGEDRGLLLAGPPHDPPASPGKGRRFRWTPARSGCKTLSAS